VAIATLFYFLAMLKIRLRSYIFFIDVYDFYYILLYISVDFMIHGCIFYLIKKTR